MIARALAVGIVCAPFISAALLGLGRAGRALRTTWTYWPDKGRRHHQIAYAVLHPHLIAYSLWLRATHSTRTRSSP